MSVPLTGLFSLRDAHIFYQEFQSRQTIPLKSYKYSRRYKYNERTEKEGEKDGPQEKVIKISESHCIYMRVDLSPLLCSFIRLFNLNSVFYNSHQSNSSHKLLKLAAARPDTSICHLGHFYHAIIPSNMYIKYTVLALTKMQPVEKEGCLSSFK